MAEPFTLLAAFNIAIALLGGLGGWSLRNLTERVKEVDQDVKQARRDLAELRVHVADRYLPRDEHKTSLDHIFQALRRIEDKIDRKQDKAYGAVREFPNAEERRSP
jgi:hypothetical protein